MSTIIYFVALYSVMIGLSFLGLATQGPKVLREEWWTALVWPYICWIGLRAMVRDFRRNWSR